MMRSLSFERLYLSSDPDDWVWGRWYWCRPGARPLGLLTAYGFQVWETDVPHPDPQPGMPLAGGAYAGERVSPYPGLHRIGRDEWYLDGVPVEDRVGDAQAPHCGVDTCWSDALVRVSGEDVVPIPRLVVRGGGAGGGMATVGGGCRIWMGGCLHLSGGGVGGGPLPLRHGEGMTLSGGGVGGGPIHAATGSSLGLEGGGVGGGPVGLTHSSGIILGGGGVGGGPCVLASGSVLLVGGGGVGGGPLVLTPSGGLLVGGGGVGGGPCVLAGSGVGYPAFVAGGRTARQASPLAYSFPGGVADGDTLVAVALVVGASAAWTTPAGWTLVASADVGVTDGAYAVFSRVWHSGDPSSLDLTYSSLSQAAGVLTAVRRGGAVTAYTPGSGLSSAMAPGATLVGADHCVMLWLGSSLGNSVQNDPPAGMAIADGAMAGTEVVEFYEDDTAAGIPADLDSALSGVDSWIAVVVTVDPI